MKIDSNKSYKLLIIRLSSIGDIILTTPILRCIKNQLPNSEIHFLTKKKYQNLIINNPNIDKIFTINSRIKEISSQLKKEEYDYIIDLHRNIRTFKLKLSLKCKSYTFNKLNFKKWIYVNFKINRLPKIHIVDRMFESVKFLNINYDNKGLDYFSNNKLILPKQINDFIISDFYVISIGGSYFTKRFPNEKVIDLCKNINSPVILIGGDTDKKNGEEIKIQIGEKCLNACGIISVEESAEIIKKSRFVISNDTGAMHIASALKKPVISIWGNTKPEFGMYPLFPKEFSPQPAIIENNKIKCRPCSKIGFNKCPKKHFKCMTDIDNSKILNYISQNKLMINNN
jgi:heptosyltransferase-2